MRAEARPFHVWLGLTLLTLLSVAFAEQGHWRSGAIVAMFGIAAVKGELVIARYMEIGRAERQWRILYRAWLAVVVLVLTTGNLVG